MAERNDITIDWTKSPRIITVNAPSTEITVQDLIDTLRGSLVGETSWNGIDEPSILNSSGKEALGGGVLVGLTAELQNAKLAFESRTESAEDGAATSGDPNGIILTDINAQFITNGVQTGATIVNLSDGSLATVVSIESETVLKHFPLDGGAENDWDIGDSYKVYNVIVCEVTGGNVVAVDENGNEMISVHPTANVLVVRTSSASATIAELEIINLQRIIESLRGHHCGTGNIWYWNPIDGNDENDGKLPDRAFKTLTKAVDSAADNNHDIIFAYPGEEAGPTISTETVKISKNYLFIRGPGRDFRIIPTTQTDPTIEIDGDGVELSGMVVSSAVGSNQHGIYAHNCDYTHLRNLYVENADADGINLNSVTNAIVENTDINHAGVDGLQVTGNSQRVDLMRVKCFDCISDGIELVGSNVKDVRIHGDVTSLYSNTGWGLKIGDGVQDTTIDVGITVHGNALGDIDDKGVRTHYSGELKNILYQGAIHIDVDHGESGLNFPIGTPGRPVNNIGDARALADRYGLKEYRIRGTLQLNQEHADWRFIGMTTLEGALIDINGQNVTHSRFEMTALTGNVVGSGMAYDKVLLVDTVGAAGIAQNSGFQNTIDMGDIGTVLLSTRMDSVDKFTVDMKGPGRVFRCHMVGDIKIINMQDGDPFPSMVDISMELGSVEIDSSCIGGVIRISGPVEVTDNSSPGCVVLHTAYFDPANIADIKLKTDDLPADPASQALVNAAITATENNIRGADNDTLKTLSDSQDSFNSILSNINTNVNIIKKIESGRWKIVNDQMIFYDSNGTTPLLTFNLSKTEQGYVYERAPA